MEPEETSDLLSGSGSDEEDTSEQETEGSTIYPRRHKPPRPSTTAVRKSLAILVSSASNRRRRRSSARFLQLNDNRGAFTDLSDVPAKTVSVEKNLSDLYDKAIRLNAENKINAGNSWNLRLIENIDNFLEHIIEEDTTCDEEEEHGEQGMRSSPSPRTVADNPKEKSTKTVTEKRVNFTKASCTLDASVKIYSYRVDDVHLTSYKVLANLNRSDTTNEKPKKFANNVSGVESIDNESFSQRSRKSPTVGSNVSTLETNLGKNVSKHFVCCNLALAVDP
jgi:condensin complex subunit 2